MGIDSSFFVIEPVISATASTWCVSDKSSVVNTGVLGSDGFGVLRIFVDIIDEGE